jgi:elongator complex protein 6
VTNVINGYNQELTRLIIIKSFFLPLSITAPNYSNFDDAFKLRTSTALAMPPSSRIPPLLQPYTQLPTENSILLVTSTLGASANWLIVRFLCDALTPTSESKLNTQDGGAKEEVNVILVSWMRDWEFWKQEARKGGGLDLERLREKGRVGFVDGLGGLFLPQEENEKTVEMEIPKAAAVGTIASARVPQILPLRGPPGRIPTKAPTSAAPATTLRQTATTGPNTDTTSTHTPGLDTLRSPSLSNLQSTIRTAITHVSTASARKTLLILDSPDLLPATTSVPPSSLTSTILSLHTAVPHILVHLSADTALLAQSTPPQPLEVAGHNFLVKMAHMSRRILSCRVLDTGVARDVSGVLRVTDNGWGVGGGLEVREELGEKEEGNRELLYFVKGDGSVKVFERGAGG